MLDLAVQVPRRSVAVVQGSPTGTDYGSVRCGRSLGAGVQWDSFETDAAGAVHVRYQQFFRTGTLYGDYELVPLSSGPPTASSFASSTLAGKIRVKNGTGAYRGMSAKGTLRCSTPDNVHFSCVERIRLA